MTNSTYLNNKHSVGTYMFPDKHTTTESSIDVVEQNISGFTIYNMFKTYTLKNHQNYQQSLSSEPIFQSYLSLAINTKH